MSFIEGEHMKIIKWLKKDWFGLIVDIAFLLFVMIDSFSIATLLLIAYVTVSTIIHYDRYKKM